MTITAPPTRRRWIWILVAVVAVAAIVTVVALMVPHPKNTVTPTPTPSRTTASPTADTAPNGCLGGSKRDADMILSAQKDAPHSTIGAVEVAAAFARWTFRHPTPNSDEATRVSRQLISSAATAQFKDLATAFAANPNPSGGAVGDGVDFYVSTAPGRWYVDGKSVDQATVSVGAGYVVDGTLNPSLRSSTTYTLVWEGGGWRIKSGEIRHTTEQLFQIGDAFAGGC